jgi:hypothetical protein
MRGKQKKKKSLIMYPHPLPLLTRVLPRHRHTAPEVLLAANLHSVVVENFPSAHASL